MDPFQAAEEALVKVRQLMTAAIPQPAPAALIELADAFCCSLERWVFQADENADPENETVLAALDAVMRAAAVIKVATN